MKREPKVGVIAVALSVVGLAVACSRAPADPVRSLLDELVAAGEARDADRFGARLSAGFHGPHSMDRAAAVATLRRYFAAYESIAVEVYGVEIDREDGAARVRCVVELSGEARKLAGLEGLLPPSAAYRFELEVAEEGGVWTVRDAAWQEAAPAQ